MIRHGGDCNDRGMNGIQNVDPETVDCSLTKFRNKWTVKERTMAWEKVDWRFFNDWGDLVIQEKEETRCWEECSALVIWSPACGVLCVRIMCLLIAPMDYWLMCLCCRDSTSLHQILLLGQEGKAPYLFCGDQWYKLHPSGPVSQVTSPPCPAFHPLGWLRGPGLQAT